MSFAESIIIAEEITRNIKIPSSKQEVVIKTQEKRPKHPHIVNYSVHEANRWYEIKLPRLGVLAWNLRCREEYNINYCFEPTASTYMTLSSGASLSQDTAPEGIHSIYIRCATADVTIELELWRDAPSLELYP